MKYNGVDGTVGRRVLSRFLIAAAAIALAATISSCRDPLTDDPAATSAAAGDQGADDGTLLDQPSDGPVLGNLSLTVGEPATARTIGPPADLKAEVTSYRVAFTGHASAPAFTIDPYVEGEAIEGIPVGAWTITLYGANAAGDIASSTPSGGNPVTIAAGDNGWLSVTLTPLLTDGLSGTLAWEITFPADDVDSGTFTIDPWPIGGGDSYPVPAGGYNLDYPVTGALSINTSLTVGDYFVTVTFSKTVDASDVAHPPISEIVQIRDNLTSGKLMELQSSDFTQPPAAPTGFTATGQSSTEIQLTWTDASNTETGFNLERSPNGSDSWNPVAADPYPLNAGSESYSDTGLTENTTYYYRLASENDFGASAWVPTSATSGSIYDVTYYANGATGSPPSSASYETGQSVNISGNTGLQYNDGGFDWLFDGWNPTTDGTGNGGVNYSVGDSITITNSDIDLYAQWTPIGAEGPGSGIVFYDDEADGTDDVMGARFLEATTSDWDGGSTLYWGGSTDFGGDEDTQAPELDAIGSGAANSAVIVAALGSGVSDPQYPARASMEMFSNGYNEWFLPSRGELNLMHDNLHVAGLGDFGDPGYSYWSSSEEAETTAWSQNFSGGGQSASPKSTNLRVRAIRAFNDGDHTYTLRYDANGATSGTVPVDLTFYEPGTNVTVLSNSGGLARTNFDLVGWNTEPDGSGTHYDAGNSLSMPANVFLSYDLYAEWQYSGSALTIRGPGLAGGIVFYDKGSYSAGWRYLEAAPQSTEWDSKQWGRGRSTSPGPKAPRSAPVRRTPSTLSPPVDRRASTRLRCVRLSPRAGQATGICRVPLRRAS